MGEPTNAEASAERGPVTYTLDDGVAVIDLDDGKANAIGFALLDALEPALEQAADEAKAVVLAGRPGRFSGGFDLGVIRGERTAELMRRGGRLALRLWTFPVPVVHAVTGHAMAMGAVLLCCADYRVGAAGEYKLGLNEVRIDLAVPPFAVDLARARLNPTHFTRATLLAEVFDPDGAVEAGYLDEVVALDHTRDRAIEVARGFAADLKPGAFRVTREIVRGALAAEHGPTMADSA
jgi:enoyl-CoA hydratase